MDRGMPYSNIILHLNAYKTVLTAETQLMSDPQSSYQTASTQTSNESTNDLLRELIDIVRGMQHMLSEKTLQKGSQPDFRKSIATRLWLSCVLNHHKTYLFSSNSRDHDTRTNSSEAHI